jgi:hypothetical protein
MTQPDNITLYNKGMIHIINREPFETNMDVYKRGWFIIKDKSHENDMDTQHKQLLKYSISLIENYKNKGMIYDI